VAPGDEISGSFTLENGGVYNSSLNWIIDEFPDWGSWTFNPSSGSSLKPKDGVVTVNVSVLAPNLNVRDFNGYIKVTNADNLNDYGIIPISASTFFSRLPLFSLHIYILKSIFDRLPIVGNFILR
jgi:hypothetical protein